MKKHFATIALAMRQKHKTILRLRQLRRARELTQQQIAKRVGIHVNAYGAIEKGKAVPSLNTAREIAKVFGESIEHVFDRIEVQP